MKYLQLFFLGMFLCFSSHGAEAVSSLTDNSRFNFVSDSYYFTATVYNDSGQAADGTFVYEGMIAVDPDVIPLGTSVYIEFPAPYEYLSGSYIAHDTGGSICGNVIDVWVPWSEYEMNNFGIREVRVYF